MQSEGQIKMRDEKSIQLTVGALLHDIGKIVSRKGQESETQDDIGYQFLKDKVGLNISEVLDIVRYHHYDAISSADIPLDSSAYIAYIANDIASVSAGSNNSDLEQDSDISAPMESVFNILNRNNKKGYYAPRILKEDAGINYPINERINVTESDYDRVLSSLCESIKHISMDASGIQILMEALESELSYVPAFISKGYVADISLYDHLKMTAAYASCIYEYLKDKGISDYRSELFEKSQEFNEEEPFLMASLDMSGIQDFIYTIATKDALKTLRARSFYLEIMMEHLVDTLLDKQGLSRANLIYSGGGHCYVLMPNTKQVKICFEEFLRETNEWFLNEYGIELYVAGGYASCSANSLRNKPEGSYPDIFKRMSARISGMKLHRYEAKDIIWLNSKQVSDYSRECKACHRMDRLTTEDICSVCEGMKKLSAKVLYEDFFAVSASENDGMEFPFGVWMSSGDADRMNSLSKDDEKIRIYGKNKSLSGSCYSTKLWTGSYTTGETFAQLAKKSEGIERIGVLRADIDNLGSAFVAGFNNPDNNDRYVSLSRTATLSRQLSLFFKLFINDILNNPEYRVLTDKERGPRNVSIVYSGGDDVFIVGAWDDIVEAAVDLRHRFERYTEGSLTISAGIGIYNPSYPVRVMADEVGHMEEMAKDNPGKDSITFFDGNVYKWDVFHQGILEGKYKALAEFFDASEERGKNFLYNMLNLVRSQNERINFARFIYLLSRMEPSEEAPPGETDRYREFSGKMIEWIQDDEERRQLESAMLLYAYHIRETEGER